MSQGFDVISHHFSGGVYAKKCIIKNGHEVAQHIHKFDHMSLLAKGCVVVHTAEKSDVYYEGEVIEIKAGIAHSVEAVNGDALWFCIHATNETDESKVDDVLIQKKENMVDTGIVVDTGEVIKVLSKYPYLWNRHTLRTENANSPHYGCDDIWVRFNDIENLDLDNPLSMHDKHESVWYVSPLAIPIADIVKQILHFDSSNCNDELGGRLITRIPAGGKVLRHNDAGRWHAEYYKDKYLISLVADENQAFCYDNERHVTQVGHVYKFNNLADHWVENNSDKDRISLIICTRHN